MILAGVVRFAINLGLPIIVSGDNEISFRIAVLDHPRYRFEIAAIDGYSNNPRMIGFLD